MLFSADCLVLTGRRVVLSEQCKEGVMEDTDRGQNWLHGFMMPKWKTGCRVLGSVYGSAAGASWDHGPLLQSKMVDQAE